jgi:cytoskeleton protein RodZ
MASFGENLRRERELRGVELREMADATKISIRFLNALEQDRVDVLPGGIFPRAFVRQYAKYLGLDPDRLVAEFVYAHGGEPVPAKGRSPVRVDQDPPRGLVLAAVAIVVLALVGWKVRGQLNRPSQAVAPSLPAPPVTTFAHDRVYPPPAAASGSAGTVNAGAFVVVVTARRSSWVEAKVDGTTVLNRVLKDGESQRLEARQEVLLSVGNAGGVTATFNDRPLGPLGRDGDVKHGIAINAQTAPAMLAAAGTPPPVPASSPGAGVPLPRPFVPRRATPQPASPSPSPSVLLLAPRPDAGFGAGGLLPPATRPSPPPRL